MPRIFKALLLGLVAVSLEAATKPISNSFNSLEMQARGEIAAAGEAHRRGEYRRAVELSGRAVRLYREGMQVEPYQSRTSIAYVYLGMVDDLIALQSGVELRCVFFQIAANGGPSEKSARSMSEPFYFMSAKWQRVRKEYEAFLAQFGPHGVSELENGKPVYGLRYQSLGTRRIAEALRDAVEGRPADGARLLDRAVTVSLGGEDFFLIQDMYYYSAWLYLAADEKPLAIKRFYQVLEHEPARPEMVADKDEIETARYLSRQPLAALNLSK